MIALGSGGVFGVGLGESVQKIYYLPEASTDMIFAIVGEELGLVGAAAVILAFASSATPASTSRSPAATPSGSGSPPASPPSSAARRRSTSARSWASRR